MHVQQHGSMSQRLLAPVSCPCFSPCTSCAGFAARAVDRMSFGRRRTSRAEQILLARAATREPFWQSFFPGCCFAATAGQSSVSLNMAPSGWQQCCEAYLLSWDIIRSPVTCRQAVHALTTAMPLHSALSELMAVIA